MKAAAPVKGRPILFSGPMVRAILDGRKTQTRRMVKPQPDAEYAKGWYADRYNKTRQWNLWGDASSPMPNICGPEIGKRGVCPKGDVGDRLWVKETWAKSIHNILYAADGVVSEGPQGNTDDWDWDRRIPNHWKPSIHMPRKASRLSLEITSIRVELVQSISEEDARAESFKDREDFFRTFYDLNGRAPRGCNPWVWVIDFKRLEAAS